MKKQLYHIVQCFACKFWKRSCQFFIKVAAHLLILIVISSLFASNGIAQEEHTESKFAQHIRVLHEELLEKGKTTDQLSESDLASLPIGIMKYIGGVGYMVIIDSAVFTPQGAFFSAYISLEHTSSGRQLAFAGKNIAFHPGGISNSTESRMYLVDKAQLPFGNKITIELHPQGNYVAFDCNGFKEVHLKGQMAFDRSMMLPEDQQGNLMEGKVKADIAFSATDFGNLLAAVRLPTFRVPALTGISFQVEDAVVDMSDMANPQGMLFPAAYFQSHGQNPALWEGIYLRKVRIGLFRELDENNQRRYVYGENLLIDKVGLSGTLSVAQIFGQEEGNMNGWPFSVDSLGITFIKNQLGGAAFKGKLQIPIFSKESPVHYTAAVFQEKEETNFRFALQPGKAMKVPALAANLVLAPNSTLIISKQEGEFKPEAILHGSLSVNQSQKASFNNIAFTDLHIASEKPYIRNGYWSLKGSGAQKAANYPIVLKEIDFLHDAQGQLNLRVDALLNLMEGSSGFSAETVISVKGEIVEEANTEQEITFYKQTWKYKETAISDIRIEADMEAYKLEGRLSLYDAHEVYGKGFRGEINASFTAAPTMKAVAQFGNVHDMRYWYVDAMFSSPTVMAPAMPGFGIYGFGGGMYYHMKVQQEDIETSELKAISGELDKYAIGSSRSGATYVPDQHVGLGLKATVALGTVPSPKPFNGDATFEMAFKSSGGLSYVGFRGEGYFMQEISERSGKAPVYAELDINYDFQNRALHAQLDSYINIGKVVRGTQYGGFAGRAIMHFDPQDWYIWLGSPSRPMGLNFLNIAEAQGYFMVGTQIEDIPPIDSKVQEIINGVDFGSRKLEAASGKGFAFGSKFNSSFGNEHTTFFGYFDIGAGFDVMLRDYGNLSCEGSTNAIGINGWYASGQAWGYLQGAVGVNVNLKYVKGRFEAFRIAGAYALEARLPNPIWLHGAVAGKFNVLGGLVKGNCHFEVEIGEQCQMQEGNPLGTEVIAELSPVNANEELNVFTTPQATFNITLDEEIAMRDEENHTRTYRVKIDHFRITQNGKTLAGAIEWNDDHNVAIFRTEDILPPKSTIKAEVQIRWEEKINGSWKSLSETESKTVSFKTGIAPDVISPENVAYSYPIAHQSNFYPKEHGQGYMKLKTGQDYLFSSDEHGNDWKHYARFSTSGQKDIEAPLSYNSTTNLLSFAIPDKLKNDKTYSLSFVKTPQTKQSIDQNVKTKDKNIIDNESVRIDMEVKEVSDNLVLHQEKMLYSSSYRTSIFNTFVDKLNSFSSQGTYGYVDTKTANLARLQARYHAPSEGFDAFELGSGDMPSLVVLEAVTTTDWYKKYPYPHMYEYYDQYKNIASIDWRQAEKLGVPPLKGMYLQSLGNTPPNTSILEGSSTAGLMDFHYDFSYYVYKDYADLYASLVYRSRSTGLGNASKGVRKLVGTHYQDLLGGNYDIKVAYRLPGTEKISSSKTFTFTW